MTLTYKNIILKLLGTLLCLIFTQFALAEQVFKSTTERVHFLELYSTQSCSSCPPAQAWVSELKTDKRLWKTFIPVVFHVDYWDYLGWKDPYSDRKYSTRQRDYVSELSIGAYTPMFIVDGQEERRRSLAQLRAPGGKVGQLIVRRKQNSYEIEFKPISRNYQNLVLYYSVLGSGINTNVTAGENNGRKLSHDFLSLKMGSKKLKKVGETFQASARINLKSTKPAPMKSIVFWVSRSGSLKPIQVAGGPIKE